MAQTSILYTEYGQQYLTLPLTIKNVTGGLVIVERIYIRNIFDKDSSASFNYIKGIMKTLQYLQIKTLKLALHFL